MNTSSECEPSEKCEEKRILEPLIIDDNPETTTENSLNQTTNYVTFVHFLKGSIGSGILAMPNAFKNAGILIGTISTFIMGFVCTHCMHILIKSSQVLRNKYHLSQLEYSQVAYTAFDKFSWTHRIAKYIKFAVNLFLCFTQFGFCCVYSIFVTNTLYDIGSNIYPDIQFIWYSIIVLIMLIFLCLLGEFNLKSITLLITNTLTAFGLICTMYYVFRSGLTLKDVRYFSSWEEFPVFFGTTVYAFEGIGMVLPLHNRMATPEDFSKNCGVLNVTMIIITMLYTLIGIFGYLKYDKCSILGSITLNLPRKETWAKITKLAMACAILLSYPLQFFVAFDIIWPFIQRFIRNRSLINLLEKTAIISFVVLTFVLTIMVPRLEYIISLVGAFSSSVLALVIPPVIEIVVINLDTSSQENKRLIIIKDIIIIIFGLFGFYFGIQATVINMAKKSNQDKEIIESTN